MLTFYDAAALEAAPRAVSDPQLGGVLEKAVRHWRSADVLHLTHLVVIQAGDTEDAIRREVGFSPLQDPIDGHRFGTPAFEPFWDWLRERAEGVFELALTVGNSGFAYVLFIPADHGVDPGLLALCRAYAIR